MSIPSPDVSTPGAAGLLGADPGLSIRRWAAGLLRVGIGLGLLNSGLIGYMGTGRAAGPTPFSALNGLAPVYSAVPYLEIALAMALIFGFLMTPAAVAAGFFTLFAPAMLTVELMVSGATSAGSTFPGRNFGNANPMMMIMGMTGAVSSIPDLLANAALIWLSPLANHPISVDALVFGRVEPEPFVIPAESGPTPPSEPAPPEGGGAIGDEMVDG